MAKRGSARKARVFTIPTRLKPASVPPPAPRAVPKAGSAKKNVQATVQELVEGTQITLRDNEVAYLVEALLDAQRGAEAKRKEAAASNDTEHAQVLANKAATLADLTTRIAQAITRRRTR